jgi:hypothetical protein
MRRADDVSVSAPSAATTMCSEDPTSLGQPLLRPALVQQSAVYERIPLDDR